MVKEALICLNAGDWLLSEGYLMVGVRICGESEKSREVILLFGDISRVLLRGCFAMNHMVHGFAVNAGDFLASIGLISALPVLKSYFFLQRELSSKKKPNKLCRSLEDSCGFLRP